MTEKNLVDEPLQDTDVTRYYAEFAKVPTAAPTKKEQNRSRLATSSHLSKGSKASSMSRQTGGSVDQPNSETP
jgi:hypothetical protein